MSAQGNALGNGYGKKLIALKGQDKAPRLARRLISPFQGYLSHCCS
jgi:hypothetical protein